MSPGVPQQTLVTEAPAVFVLAQHVDEGVHVEPGLVGPDAEHHAGAEDPLGDVDLPVEPAPVECPGPPDPGRPVAPVGVEVSCRERLEHEN